MMKLYIIPGSPYARMARIVVHEKGLESRVEIVAAKIRAADSPHHAINPSARVPYLVADDGVGGEESALGTPPDKASQGTPKKPRAPERKP